MQYKLNKVELEIDKCNKMVGHNFSDLLKPMGKKVSDFKDIGTAGHFIVNRYHGRMDANNDKGRDYNNNDIKFIGVIKNKIKSGYRFTAQHRITSLNYIDTKLPFDSSSIYDKGSDLAIFLFKHIRDKQNRIIDGKIIDFQIGDPNKRDDLLCGMKITWKYFKCYFGKTNTNYQFPPNKNMTTCYDLKIKKWYKEVNLSIQCGILERYFKSAIHDNLVFNSADLISIYDKLLQKKPKVFDTLFVN